MNPMTVPSSSTATSRMPGSAARSSPDDEAGQSTPPNRWANRVSPASSMPARKREVGVPREADGRHPQQYAAAPRRGVAAGGRSEDHHEARAPVGRPADGRVAPCHTRTASARSSARRPPRSTRPSRPAVARASTTVRGLDWFEVTEIRGHLADGAIAHYQVGLKLGFRLEE